MSLTLHFHPLASFCWKALIALYENGTPFKPHIVDLGDEAARAALQEAVADRQVSGAARRGARPHGARNRASSSNIWRSIIRAPMRLIPADPERARQMRLRDRFYDLYVHLPMQKIVDRPAAAGRQERSASASRRRKATAGDRARHDRAGHGDAGPGRRAKPSPWPIARPAPALFYADMVMPFADYSPERCCLSRPPASSARPSRACSRRPSPTSTSCRASLSRKER